MRRFTLRLAGLCALAAANGVFVAVLAAAVLYPKLPDLDVLADYKPKLPLRVYTAEGEIIGEFGEEKRTVVALDDIPPALIAALLATEDAYFYRHQGVDFRGLARGVIALVKGRGGGTSTITMQVAREFFLTKKRAVLRKIFEILLAFKIERRFSKQRILEFYMNQIFLGHGSFGFATAARTYYGKRLDELTLAEVAVLAGIPKAPSRYNPISRPARAKERQKHVLGRMRAVGLIDDGEFVRLASDDLPSVSADAGARRLVTRASWAAEEVRKLIYERYGEEAYQRGFRVFTTIRGGHQRAATAALRRGLLAYDARRAYRGPSKYFDLSSSSSSADADGDWQKLLAAEPTIGGLSPALILAAEKNRATAFGKEGERVVLCGKSIAAVRGHLPGGGKKQLLRRGALIYLAPPASEADAKAAEAQGCDARRIAQIPQAQGALIALSPEDGAIVAMAGGFDFAAGKFNHATQARRQPGSSLKPFIFSASLEKGFTAASVIEDAPIYLTAEETGSSESWEPHNYDGKYAGPIRLREALAKSKNLATVRLLKSIGADYAQDYLTRFGFAREDHPPYLTLGLGAGLATPLELAAGYAVFANGGYLVHPYLIARVEDFDGNVVEYKPDFESRRRAIDPRNAFVMTTMLQSVITAGTGRGARSLRRDDIAGKTGTTNDTRDAWFAGFNPEVVAVSWVGFDTPRSLGKKETGARAALPIWRSFMEAALVNSPEFEYLPPAGVVAAQIDETSGRLLPPDADGGMREYFYQEYLPPLADAPADDRDQLF